MKLVRLEIQGFRSFTAPQSIDFSALKPGLYHVKGENLVEPELGGNGVGKSSLFEAVYWTLYDKTSRGLRAAAVKNWHSRERCAGILDVETAAGPLSVLRIWKPNTLEVALGDKEPRAADQTEVEKLAGIPADAFLYSIYFAQFTPAFVDLKPAEQTALFTSVLGLGIWERAAEVAQLALRAADEIIAERREEKARLEGQAEGLLSQDFDREEKAWAAEHKRRTKELEARIRGSQKALKSAAQACQERAGAFLGVVEGLARYNRELSLIEGQRQELERQLARLEAKNLTKCPTCGQAISNGHIKKEIARVRNEALALTQREKEPRAALDKLREQEKGAREQQELEARLDQAAKEANVYQGEWTRLQQEQNPFTRQREKQEQRAEEIVHALEASEAALLHAERERAALAYWPRGFKELRLSLIRESLEQLTAEANETLFALGLREWSVEFDVERETKAGAVNRNFSIMVRAPHVKDAVPWEAWSGGESQRLRLSISLGFANLIASRLGMRPNVELWDEPSTWLNESGIYALLSVLAERALSQGKVILLADHRALDFGGFTGTVQLTKSETGTRLEIR